MRSNLTGNKDLDLDILNRLNDRDLVSFCRTSKYANQLCNDQILWQRRSIGRFGYIPLEVMKKFKGDRTWSDYYIELSKNVRTNIDGVLVESSAIGRLDLVILALNQAADIHYDDNLSLGLASQNGHLEVVKYLVSQGADIHAEDDYALGWASNNGQLEVIKYLVNQGVDIQAQDDYVLKSASKYGHLEVVKYSINKGADIHANDDEALRLSSLYGHLDVVKYLVNKGADIHAKNDYALKNGTPDVVQYLKEQIN